MKNVVYHVKNLSLLYIIPRCFQVKVENNSLHSLEFMRNAIFFFRAPLCSQGILGYIFNPHLPSVSVHSKDINVSLPWTLVQGCISCINPFAALSKYLTPEARADKSHALISLLCAEQHREEPCAPFN